VRKGSAAQRLLTRMRLTPSHAPASRRRRRRAAACLRRATTTWRSRGSAASSCCASPPARVATRVRAPALAAPPSAAANTPCGSCHQARAAVGRRVRQRAVRVRSGTGHAPLVATAQPARNALIRPAPAQASRR
jgi:hypothetical protein